jgi:hypothetical protein
MKNIMKLVLVAAVSMSGVAFAEHHENCQVGDKKVHVKTKKECKDQQGTWIKAAKKKKEEKKAAESAAPAEAAPAPAEAAPATEQK